MPRRPLFLAGLIAFAAAATAVHGQEQAGQQTPPASAPDPAAIEIVAAAIRAALAALPEGASPEDVEAAIVFAVDQTEAAPEVAIAALAKVEAETDNPVLLAALGNVRALRNRLARRGTGSIPGSAGGGLAIGPILTTGGGTSDYE